MNVKIKIIVWQENNFWLGYAEEYPDYITQGFTLEELKNNISDIYKDLSEGYIPGARHEEKLVIA